MNNEITGDDKTGFDVAVIGMAGRFPGAGNVVEFWENLKNGVESVSFFSDEELDEAGAGQEEPEDDNYVKARPVLDKAGYFDSHFFDYTPIEAEIMDPQMRILHECAWEALEDAGYDPDSYDRLIGFYAGTSSNLKWQLLVYLSQKDEILGEFAANHLLDRDFFSTRVSHRLNLKGPAVTLQTACSTSLVAVHMGCQGLLSGDCDIALAGGVTSGSLTHDGYLYQDGMIKSPDGHCRAFDADAKGTIFGGGVGMVMLKRLNDALGDGDHIYAVIKGSAVNNDGIEKAGYTAPGVRGQEEVICNAYQVSEVEPESIGYIEAHGTGTALGDPVEIEALKLAFNTGKKGYCAIGSVKTNVGHLDIAAGIAGFIKTVLALKYRIIPPSLHYKTPNPNIDFENSPFYVNTRLREWKNDRYPLRAGVSSFGIGGTNAHVVLEEAPGPDENEMSASSRAYQLILLSAKTATALGKICENLKEYLINHPDIPLADVAYTLQAGRKSFQHRKMLVAANVQETIHLLGGGDETSPDSLKLQTFNRKTENPPVIFMFPGQGAQYVNMGWELYQTETVFREEMDRCFDILNALTEYNIKEILYPVSGDTSTNLNQTLITQPVLFAFEYALARMLMKWGIKPYALIGHSIGEYVAACLSSVFSLEDALTLVGLRGKLMQRMPTGAMRSISLSREKLKPFLNNDISLAAVNSSNHCVISGTHEAVETWAVQMEANGCNTRKLHTSHAFHSSMMEPILKKFEEEAGKITLSVPQIPFISNVTGHWLANEEAVNPGYWSTHLRRTVQFCDGLSELLKKEPAIFMEVGPGKSLSTFVRQHRAKNPGHKVIDLVRHPHEDIPDSHFLLSRLGQCWLYGGRPDWPSFYAGQKRRRVSLPGYPFEGQRYVLDPGLPEASDIALWKLGGKRPAGKKSLPGWFYIPSWKRTVVPVPREKGAPAPLKVLLFTHESPLGMQLRESLENDGHKVIIAGIGDGFTRKKEGEYAVKPGLVDDYETLLTELRSIGMMPHRIVHLWNISRWNHDEVGIEESRQCRELGFYSLIYLARALEKQGLSEPVQITVLTTRMQEVNGAEALCPSKATVLGPVMIIPLEYTNIDCQSIDIELPLPAPGSRKEKRLVNRLLEEIGAGISDRIVAYQGPHRLVRTFEPVRLDVPGDAEKGLRIKEKGVYLVTGGLGGIGLVLAKHLAKSRQARLVLTGRSAFPPPGEWEQWLSVHGEFDAVSRKIRAVGEMESLGAEVLVYPADAADYRRMENLFSLVKDRWGGLDGIIHCAGVPGGGMIRTKKREDAEKVLAPKVTGTLVLDRLLKLKGIEPDFILLCSSVNSLVPIVGQVDYSAANAFLDAFAHYKTARDGVLTISVNWDTWREVGMAVEAARGWGGTRNVGHPLLDRRKAMSTNKAPEQEIYLSRFTFQGQWVLHEHMTADRQGVVPGTTYLEMVRAAFATREGDGPVEISDVQFLTPLMVREGEAGDVALILKRRGSGYDFLIAGRGGEREGSGSEGKPRNHAVGTVGRAVVEGEESKKHELEKIVSLFSEGNTREVIIPGGNDESSGPEGLLVFGGRWKSLKWAKQGKNHGLALLELAGEYMEDLRSYKLHPALLDIATAFLNSIMNKERAYIPFSYRRLIIKKDLPGRFLSYCRLLENNSPVREQVKFDVTLFDEQGTELVTIDEFTMLEVSEEVKDRIVESASAGSDPGAVESGVFDFGQVEPEFLKNGILPAEGIDAFTRIAAGELSQVAVSTTDLERRIEKSGLSGAWRLGEEIGTAGTSGPAHARPELGTAYVAPESGVEKALAKMWQELLGIGEVGINDDFFELGGDSLKAIGLGGRIHKELNTGVPLAEFFNRPTIKKLSEYIAGTPGTDEFYSVNPVERKEYYPLSSAQKRLYILHQMEPLSIVHNLWETVKLEGKVEKTKIEEVFHGLIARHESFRTSFAIIQGGPVQRIHDRVEFNIDYIPAGSAADERESRETGEQEMIIGNIIRPFDLSKAPLLRVGLIQQEEDLHLLVVDVHHTVYDGTSQAVVFKEFMDFYAGETLTPLSIRYKDYSEWQNRNLKTESIKLQGEYWKNEFQGEIPVLNLPYDFTRPVVQSYEGRVFTFDLGGDETKGLRTLASRQGVTLYMVLFTIYTVLLSRLSGQQDIVIGTPTAGRKHPDLAAIIGMFLNTLALRNYPAAHKPFRAFLQEIKERILPAFENQDYPFEQLVEDLDVNRDLSRSPLFDVMFILHNELNSRRISAEAQIELKMRHHGFSKVTSQYDLTLVGFEVESERNIYFEVEYGTKLFNEGSIRRFVSYFKRAVSSVLKDPGKKLSQLELISEEEMNRLLWEFNATSLEYPQDKSIHRLFAGQAAGNPGHTAVIGVGHTAESVGQLQITYRELDEKAGQLACVLREKGVQPGSIVGIMVERRLEMLIGLMGILKSGGAYLPLDPEYPQSRIRYILEKSGTSVLVTGENLLAKCGEVAFKGEIVDFTARSSGRFNLPGDSSGGASCEPAYVIYTSGSTGNPKGVVVTHGNSVNFIAGMKDKIDFSPGKRILALTTISFDIFFLETLLPLTCGLQVVIADENQQADPRLLHDVVVSRQIDMMQVTPSRLKLLMGFDTGLSCLEKVGELMVGGEAFPVHLFAGLKEKYRGRIYNMYGPTETTIWSAVKDLTEALPEELTIGTPIANTQVYIVDRHMQIQPLGAAGELLIGGDGAAAGYLNNVELTAEKFIFSSYRSYESYRTYSLYFSKKLYKTGDLARWLPAGEIEFLGRIDHQVKIRGFRIELEEIEEQLMKHENIKEAVVTAKENKKGDQYLSAYIVPHSFAADHSPGTSQLREYLSRGLPGYMVPSYFVRLEEMPLTPNGKINKKALPEPLEFSGFSGVTYVEPQDDLQRMVAGVWKEELELEKVGVNDNFFDLGGNSMDVIRVSNRLKEVLQIDVTVVSLFKYRTIRSFVEYLGQEGDGGELLAVKDRSEALKRGERDKRRRLEVRRRINR